VDSHQNHHTLNNISISSPKMMKSCVLLALVAVASATTLTPDNWDEMTAGKTVFIKFQAPW